MGLFKKEKKEIPEIQANPTFSPSPAIPLEASMPIPPQPTISQTPMPIAPQATMPIAPQPTMPQPTMPIAPQPHSIPHPELPQPSIAPQPITSKTQSITRELELKENTTIVPEQPFFVRIDKFSETKENFQMINEKIKEMEKVLRSLESTKQEEERELEIWKQDMSEMKSLLISIDKEIFNKL